MLDICALICVFTWCIHLYKQEEGSQLGILSLLYYGYGVVQNKMIRDQNIVGICNAQLAEKRQLDPNLTGWV